MSDVLALQSILDDFRQQTGAPGIATALRVDGNLHWTGSSTIGEPFPLAPRFPIYSVTKTLTAIAILRLHETAGLSFTSPITQLLPELSLPNSITLIHLLQHTSGLRDYGPLKEYHAAVHAHPSQPWDDQKFLAAVLPLGQLFAPGAGWSYSNVGYMLLRQVLQRTTGKSFRQCIEDLIAIPLNLHDTFAAETIADWSTCVPGYGSEITVDSEPIDIRPIYHPLWCAPGVVVSTPQEITQIFDALFAGSLLQKPTLKMMLTLTRVPGHHPPAVSPSCGLGILADPDSPLGPSFGHGGGGPGYNIDVAILPNSPLGRLTLATFVTTSTGPSAAQAQAKLLGALVHKKA
jgi:D-alanyl-D-alanine carboxypeptidase